MSYPAASGIILSSGASVVPTRPPDPLPPVGQGWAKVPDTGYVLINGTGVFIQVQAPNDGKQHGWAVTGLTVVTGAETGGQLVVQWTLNGTGKGVQCDAGGRGIGTYVTPLSAPCDPGTIVQITQNTALTAGAAIFYGGIAIVW